MKTVRFSQIIAKCGKPETHLVLVDPKKDRTLQAAIKAHRVMTVKQQTTGTKAERGEVGFDPGPSRQFLIFPKSLQKFAGKSVVGINYDLFIEPTTRRKPQVQKQHAKPVKKASKPEKKQQAKKTTQEKPAKAKIIPFKRDEEEVTEDENPEVAALKSQVRRAMSALEQGKQVAAFNLLKRIVGD